jgi:hypothetical protein
MTCTMWLATSVKNNIYNNSASSTTRSKGRLQSATQLFVASFSFPPRQLVNDEKESLIFNFT